jgi:hypothetical protein
MRDSAVLGPSATLPEPEHPLQEKARAAEAGRALIALRHLMIANTEPPYRYARKPVRKRPETACDGFGPLRRFTLAPARHWHSWAPASPRCKTHRSLDRSEEATTRR